MGEKGLDKETEEDKTAKKTIICIARWGLCNRLKCLISSMRMA